MSTKLTMRCLQDVSRKSVMFSRQARCSPIMPCYKFTSPRYSYRRFLAPLQKSHFHIAARLQASSLSADDVMEELNELYATAKDEFEIAAEETEKKTVYAAEDREGAREALKLLQDGFQKAVSETSPGVAKEIQSRVGKRIRELENAVTAMEESAMED